MKPEGMRPTKYLIKTNGTTDILRIIPDKVRAGWLSSSP
jgi:hypothetical protein